MSSPDGHLISFSRVPADLRPLPLERFARRLRDEVAGGRDFHCRITGDAELRRLNRDFLGKEYPTDVLSFPSCGGDSLGDLAISAARARAQAREHGHDIGQEVGILMLHGVLHLLGMDHEGDGGRMARAEVRWRRKLGLPAGLIERAGRTSGAGSMAGVGAPVRQKPRKKEGGLRPGIEPLGPGAAGGADAARTAKPRRGGAKP